MLIFDLTVAADVPRCKKGDSVCIVNSANIVMKTYSKGKK